MGTVFNKKGYIKTPEETSNKVMHDNIPDKKSPIYDLTATVEMSPRVYGSLNSRDNFCLMAQGRYI